MDIVSSLIGGVISSLCVGVILAFFNKRLDQNVENAKEANNLKFQNVHDKLQKIEELQKQADKRIESIAKELQKIETKVEISNQTQHFNAENLSSLRKEIEIVNGRVLAYFGKVTVHE